jgi:hypothetical protein
MKQPEDSVHGLAVPVDALKHGTGTAFFGGGSMNTGLPPILYTSGMQPAGYVNRPTMSLTGSIGTVLGQPTVDDMTTLSQLDNRRFELIQHFPAFHKEFINNFGLF